MVVVNGVEIFGWVYLKNWVFCILMVGNIQLECVWDWEFNGVLYFYISDGFVICIDFVDFGFQGFFFMMVFNISGFG